MHNIKRSGLLLVSLLSLLLLVLPQKGIAQTYPVQTNVHLVAPYGKHLNDYYATTNEKLIVTLLNKDQLKPTMEVRLRMTITASNGLKIQSKEGVNYPTINLDAGIPTRLSQEDLMPYFTNIISSGYFDQGKLPDGQIEFSFQAIEQYTGKVLSTAGTARAWLTTQKPPILQLPSNDEWVAFSEHLHLKFQWTPQHKNISQVEYQFQLRELPDYGAAPQSSFLYAPVIYEDRLLYTNLIYDVMMPPLEPNKLYGWRVQAIAKDGVDELSLFENNGFSEVFWFRTGDNCPPPIGVQATVQDRKVNLTWVADLLNNEFIVQYRPKYGTADQDWKEVKSFEPQATLYDINRGTTYEYRVGAICTSGNPFYSVIGEVSVPKVDSTRLLNCGVPPILHLENQDRLPELKVGDVVHLSDYPMTVTKASGSNGSFTGEGWVPMNWLLETKWAVEFNNISVNTDYKLIGGSVRAKYDEKEGNIANIDHITEGGGDNTREGIVKVVKLNIVIPPDPVFKYNEAKGEVIVFDSNNQSQPVPLPKDGNGKVVFPVIVQDRDGNIHKIDVPRDSEGNPIVDSDGNPQKDKDGNVILESTHLGNQGTPLSKDSFDPKGLSSNVAVITFERGAGKYAFDTWIKGYENISKIKPHYERLASGDKDYHIPWKLLPEGESDVVKATIEISKDNKEKDFDPAKVIFTTQKGTKYSAKYENKAYIISLITGAPNDIQEIYALYPIGNSTEQYYTLGKLNIITYKQQQRKITLVQVNGKEIDQIKLEQYLKDVYGSVGVTWTVSKENFEYNVDTKKFFEGGSKVWSKYNKNMETLQSAYKSHKGKLEDGTSYLFILDKSGSESGFMPLGKTFGYIFTGEKSTFKDVNHTIAHELGHGVWGLSHTFDSTYGSEFKETDTDNLMSYSGGSHIAKWQWDVIDEPAWFTNPFDGDEKSLYEKGKDGYGVTPSGQIIASKDTSKKFKDLNHVVGINSYQSPNDYAIYYFSLYDIHDKLIYKFSWNGEKYVDSLGIVYNIQLINEGETVIFKNDKNNRCYTRYKKIKWSKGDTFETIHQTLELENNFGGAVDFFVYPDAVCRENLYSDTGGYYSDCSDDENKLKDDKEFLINLSKKDDLSSNEITKALEETCFTSLRNLDSEIKMKFIKILSSNDLKDEDQSSVLKVMSALYTTEYNDFILYLLSSESKALKYLSQNMKESIFFFKIEGNSLSNFKEALNYMILKSSDMTDEIRWSLLNSIIKIQYKNLSKNEIDNKSDKLLIQLFTNVLDNLENNPSVNDLEKVFFRKMLVPEVESLQDYKVIYELAQLRFNNQSAFATYTQADNFNYKTHADASFMAQITSAIHSPISDLDYYNWLNPKIFNLNSPGGNQVKIGNYDNSQPEYKFMAIKDLYPWSKILYEDNQLQKNIDNQLNILMSIQRFRDSFAKYILSHEIEAEDILKKFGSIDCSNVNKAIQNILLYYDAESISNIDHDTRCEILKAYINCDININEASLHSREYFIIELLSSFKRNEEKEKVLKYIEKNIGVKKIFEKFSSLGAGDNLTAVLLVLSNMITSSNYYNVDAEKEVDLIDNINSIPQLEQDMFVFKNLSWSFSDANKLNIGEYYKNVSYNQLISVEIAGSFTVKGIEFKKGTVVQMPAIQAALMSRLNTVSVAGDAAWLALDVGTLVIGVGGAKIIFTAGNLIRKSIVVADLVGSTASILTYSLNKDAISPELRSQIQIVSFVMVMPTIVTQIPKVNKFVTHLDDIIARGKNAKGASLTASEVNELTNIRNTIANKSGLMNKFVDKINTYPILKQKYESMSETLKARFADDFANVSSDILSKLNKADSELLEGWMRFRTKYPNKQVCM